MSPILDLQKRARELGRIRIGQVVPTQSGKTRPEKLDRFRLTSASKPLLEKVAELYGGEVVEWTPQGGGPQAWEVVTTSTRLPIMVPPQPVTQWYEFWTAGGCKHRCDGQTNWQTGEPCDLESNDHLEAIKRPTTRLNVVLRDVEGIGVWRLETHGWNAAVELPDAAAFLAAAGGYVNGWVSLEERKRVVDGKTNRFMVPIIEIDVTPAELMAGKGRIQAPAIEGPVVEQKAIEAGPSEQPALSLPTDADIAAATLDGLRAMWQYLEGHGALDTNGLGDKIMARVQALKTAEQQQAQAPGSDESVDAEIVDDTAATATGDPDAEWQQVLKVAGEHGMSLTDVVDDFEQRYAMNPASASAGELAAYRRLLETGEVVPA